MKKTILYFILTVVISHSLLANTTWTGEVDNDWLKSSNWTNDVPFPGNNAIIPVKAMYTHDPHISTFETALYTIENSGCLTIQFNGNLLNLFTLTNYGTINILGEINNDGGTVTNDGANIKLTNTGLLFNFNGGVLNNKNEGQIIADGNQVEIYNQQAGTFVNMGSNTLIQVKNEAKLYNENAGTTFTNQGSAKIEITGLSSTFRNRNEASFTNKGTNTTLQVKNEADFFNEHTGTTFQNQNGGKIEITGVWSSFTNSLEASITNTGAGTLMKVENEAGFINEDTGTTFQNENGAKIEITGIWSSFDNSLGASLNNTGLNTVMRIKNMADFTNEDAGTTLTNQGNATIEITGLNSSFFNQAGASLTNNGSNTAIYINDEAKLINETSINTSNNAKLINSLFGTIENASSGIITSGEIIINSLGSTFDNDGIIYGHVNNYLGLVKGNGTIHGQVFSEGGTEDPGNSPGILVVNGNYIHSDSSTYRVEIESNAGAGTGHDQLQVDTAILQNGTLEVVLLNGFNPTLGDTYNILTFTSRVGTFDTLNLPTLPNGNIWAVHYNPIEITLEILGPLPVEMVYFRATKKGTTSSLKWQIASETNNDHFIVEHSKDGQFFQSIAQIAGDGTTSSRNNYSFEHQHPMIGENYYRLRQVDFDGSYIFSGITTVFHPAAEFVTITPTLAKDYVQIEFKGPTFPAKNITVYDLHGRQVQVTFKHISTGLLQANVETLTPGQYVIKLMEKGKTVGLRFVKQ